MCQLLGMNCNVPTDIVFSFEGFHARGGLTDEHRDGWGIAFYEGRGVRVFLDTLPASSSPVARLLKEYPIHSLNVIAHIRKATQGVVSLENTHPFKRELWGQYWVFAHNGDLKGAMPASTGRYRPVGDTDSELAFCFLLNTLHERCATPPPLTELIAIVADVNHKLAGLGSFNYLLSNGLFLLAHCSTKLRYVVRQAPFGTAHLIDQDLTVDFNDVTTPEDIVAVIATEPLTDNEAWTTMRPGQLLAFVHGRPIASD